MQAENTHKSYLDIRVNAYILDELKERFGNQLMITKKELSPVLNLSVQTISNRMSLGTLKIRYIKYGQNQQSGVRFSLLAVAEYLTEELCYSVPLVA
jgi:hypothetical protein